LSVKQNVKVVQGKCCQREADNDCKNDVKDGFFHGGSFDGAEAPVDYITLTRLTMKLSPHCS
jgi:hypothetical protein